MLMTNFAMMDPGPAGDSILSRCCRAIAHFFGFDSPPVGHQTSFDNEIHPLGPRLDPAAPPELHVIREPDMATETTMPHKWRRHEQLLHRPTSALPSEERHARHHAVRGLYAARAGALEIAEVHFAQAAMCPDVDLCDIPGFWQLDRTAMMTAVQAYEHAGRIREASALSARIRTQFRPRVLSPVPDNVTELPVRRHLSVSSNT